MRSMYLFKQAQINKSPMIVSVTWSGWFFWFVKMDIIETLKAKGNFLKILRMQPMVAEQYNNCQRLPLTIQLQDLLTMTIEIFNIVFLLRPVSFNNKSISKWIHNFISFFSDFSVYVQLSVTKLIQLSESTLAYVQHYIQLLLKHTWGAIEHTLVSLIMFFITFNSLSLWHQA